MKNPIQKYLAWILSAIMLFAGFGTPQVAFADQSKSMIQGEFIIALENDGNGDISIRSVEGSNHDQVFKANGFNIKGALHNPSIANNKGINMQQQKADVLRTMGYVYLLDYKGKYTSYSQAEAAIRKTLQGKGIKIKYIEPNYRLYATGDYRAAMHTSQQWHYNMIKAPEAWQVTQGYSAVKIAVLDTGIDHNHPSLKNFVNTSLAKNFTSESLTDTMDRQGHGTHVAGTIASYGVVSGVMKNASLIPVKVLGDDGSGTLYGIEQGILYASEMGADVINMSLGGGGYAQSMADACRVAHQRGTVVVAATGNDGAGTVSYPGAYPYVIGVGSVTETKVRSSFSNYGTGLDIMAPGSNIYSTSPGAQYKVLSGTSMATPHVAGVCGLIRSVNKQLSAQQVEEIIKSTAQPAGSSNQYGSGIVNAYQAVLKARGDDLPVDKKTTVTASVDKNTLYVGERVTATATVKDSYGAVLPGATVSWQLTKPNGTSQQVNAVTGANGTATYTYTATTQDTIGLYQLKADVTLSGYQSSTASTQFEIAKEASEVTVTGYSFAERTRWISSYYGYRLYNTSAKIYIHLSDGTKYLHGKETASSWSAYPSIRKTISGEAVANSTGEYISYSLSINIAPR